MDLDAQTARKLAGSLTAESVELLPYLPYLLQDLQVLGTPPDLVIELLGRHMPEPGSALFLDLACGKGAVSVGLARAFGARVTGLDLLPEFIDYARAWAAREGLGELCQFRVEDIKLSVERERGHDCVILGAVGDVLGAPEETLKKLAGTIRPGGFIVVDDAYLNDSGQAVKYDNYEYLPRARWLEIFSDLGLRLLAEREGDETEEDERNAADLAKISLRARELAEREPGRRDLFEAYVESQKNEVVDLEEAITGVLWLLQKEVESGRTARR